MNSLLPVASLLNFAVVACIHSLHLLLVLVLSRDVDAEAQPELLRIGILLLHGVDIGRDARVFLE